MVCSCNLRSIYRARDTLYNRIHQRVLLHIAFFIFLSLEEECSLLRGH